MTYFLAKENDVLVDNIGYMPLNFSLTSLISRMTLIILEKPQIET